MREYLRERFEKGDVTVRRGESKATWERKGVSFGRDHTHVNFPSLTTFRARFLYYYFQWIFFRRIAEYDRDRGTVYGRGRGVG